MFALIAKFATPIVGKQIKVTTRWPNQVITRPGKYIDHVYVGTVLSDTQYTPANGFEMTGTEEPERVPLRQILMKNVINLEYVDGTVAAKADASAPKDDVWEVEGSKGKTYVVRKINGKVTCTCPGFQFRKSCKHSKAKQ